MPNHASGYTEMKLIKNRLDLAGAKAMGWEGVALGDVIVKTVTFKVVKGMEALKMVPGLEVRAVYEAVEVERCRQEVEKVKKELKER